MDRKEEKLATQREVLRLRSAGLTFTQIGKELGFNRQRAWIIYQCAIRRERDVPVVSE